MRPHAHSAAATAPAGFRDRLGTLYCRVRPVQKHGSTFTVPLTDATKLRSTILLPPSQPAELPDNGVPANCSAQYWRTSPLALQGVRAAKRRRRYRDSCDARATPGPTGTIRLEDEKNGARHFYRASRKKSLFSMEGSQRSSQYRPRGSTERRFQWAAARYGYDVAVAAPMTSLWSIQAPHSSVESTGMRLKCIAFYK